MATLRRQTPYYHIITLRRQTPYYHIIILSCCTCMQTTVASVRGLNIHCGTVLSCRHKYNCAGIRRHLDHARQKELPQRGSRAVHAGHQHPKRVLLRHVDEKQGAYVVDTLAILYLLERETRDKKRTEEDEKNDKCSHGKMRPLYQVWVYESDQTTKNENMIYYSSSRHVCCCCCSDCI